MHWSRKLLRIPSFDAVKDNKLQPVKNKNIPLNCWKLAQINIGVGGINKIKQNKKMTRKGKRNQALFTYKDSRDLPFPSI